MYVTQVSKNYVPLVYGNRRDLDNFLKIKPILNKSKKVLKDEEIESLALGLNFIPTLPRAKREKLRKLETTKFTKDVNKKLHWLIVKSEEIKKGFLEKIFTSQWEPPKRPWSNDEKVIMNLKDYVSQSTIRPTPQPTPQKIINSLEQLARDPTINITPADKGGCIVLWPDDEYRREMARQLSDVTTYYPIESKQIPQLMTSLTEKRKNIADELLALDIITQREHSNMVVSKSEASPIYFLPKIHKSINKDTETFQGRPIVATYNSPFYLIDKLITEITSPLLGNIPGTSKDTISFLKRLEEIEKENLPEDARMLTADVVSLYPSIPWETGIDAATQYYAQHLEELKKIFNDRGYYSKLPGPQMFSKLLSLVMKNSVIHFRNELFYRQIKGTSMGISISVFFANTFMYRLTRYYIERPLSSIIYWTRFIDDFYILTTGTLTEIENMFRNMSTDDIKYTLSELAKEGTFLDVSLSINRQNIMETAPYTKPNSTSFYLHAKSNHPPSTIAGVPKAQILRYRRISSTDKIFMKHAKNLIKKFQSRGYKLKDLKNILAEVLKIPRSNTLQYSEKSNTFSNAIKLIRKYSPHYNWQRTRQILGKLQNSTADTFINTPLYNHFVDMNVKLVFETEPNIRSQFSRHIKKGHTH